MKYAFEALLRNEFETRSDEFDNKTIYTTNPVNSYGLELGLW